MADDTPGPPGLMKLLGAMESVGASDLFVCEGKKPAARIHGSVRPIEFPPTTREEMTAFLAEVLTPSARKHFEEFGDLDVGVSVAGARRVRINLARQRGALSLVARALPPGDVPF